MNERGFAGDAKEAEVSRTAEEIRRDIAQRGEDISQTVDRIGERIKEKFDWRRYVSQSPYWALGAAAGLGYLASGMFKTRTTPVERFMDSISEKARDSLGGVLAGAAAPGLIKAALLAVATRAAAGWLKNAGATAVTSHGAGSQSQTGEGLSNSPRVEY